MLKYIILSFIILLNLHSSDEYIDYLVDYSKRGDVNNTKVLKSYKQAYKKALDEYKQNILKVWPEAEISSNTKWVEYTNNYKYKKVIDYKKKILHVEVVLNDEKNVSNTIIYLYEDLNKYDTYKAFNNDHLERKINKYLNLIRNRPLENTKLISDVLTKQEQEDIIKLASLQNYKKTKYKNNTIYKSSIKLPSDFTIRKAKKYNNFAIYFSKKSKLPKNLVLSIMHVESAFNPLAKSHIPAFGLMQIVPKTAGIDAYYKLYGKKKVLSSRYLFKAKNNIKIGSTYLNILYYNYLNNIKNDLSKLYCVIASYNAGVNNVIKTFGKKISRIKAIDKINQINSTQVYKKLLRKLPAKETRLYLSKVTRALIKYNKLNL